MKKLFTVLLMVFVVSGLMVNEAQAQNLAKGQVGFNIQTGGGTGSALILGAGYERAFTDQLSGSFQLDGLIGFGDFLSMMYMSPDVKYFITGSAFDGFYAGGYFGLGFRSNVLYFNVGPTGGYMFEITDNLILDAFLRLGYGSLSYDTGFFGRVSQGGLHMAIGAGVGYEF